MDWNAFGDFVTRVGIPGVLSLGLVYYVVRRLNGKVDGIAAALVKNTAAIEENTRAIRSLRP